MASNQSNPRDLSKQKNPSTGHYQVEDDIKDTGEYQSDQVHEVLVSSHRIPPDDPNQASADDDIDTGEYQADQVRQIHASKH